MEKAGPFPPIELQQDELEALEAIFMDACTVQCANPPTVRVAITGSDVDATADAAQENEELMGHMGGFALVVSFVEAYPDTTVPHVTLDGDLEPLLVLARPRLPLVLDKTPAALVLRKELMEAVAEMAVQCVGSPMVYDLVTCVRDWVRDRATELVAFLDAGGDSAVMAAKGVGTVDVGGGGSGGGGGGGGGGSEGGGVGVGVGGEAKESVAGAAAAGAAAVGGGGANDGGGTEEGGEKAGRAGQFVDLGEEEDKAALEEATKAASEADVRLGAYVNTLRGRWDYVVGLVGKPSAGKSTFFNGATARAGVPLYRKGLSLARVGAFPFTTIVRRRGRRRGGQGGVGAGGLQG